MKQYITVEQLTELKQEKIIKLSYLVNIDYWNCDKPYYAISNALNIGKMTELLINSLECFDITAHNDLHIGYKVGTLYQDGDYNPLAIYSSPKWLKKEHTEKDNREHLNSVYCDSLWGALRTVLNI